MVTKRVMVGAVTMVAGDSSSNEEGNCNCKEGGRQRRGNGDCGKSDGDSDKVGGQAIAMRVMVMAITTRG